MAGGFRPPNVVGGVNPALLNWRCILKPGGFLYVVVPDYILYEKMNWPSLFNGDHKQSFSRLITRRHVRRPNHWHLQDDLEPLLQQLGLRLQRVTLEDHQFNYNAGPYDQTSQQALAQLCVVAKKV